MGQTSVKQDEGALHVDQNIGTMDAYLRVSGGLMMVALGAAAMTRRSGLGSFLAVALGSMKVAEGVTRYDPMYDAMGISTLEKSPAKQLARLAGKATDMDSEATERLTRKAEEYLT